MIPMRDIEHAWTCERSFVATYDGVHSFTYDAWNRLVKVAKGFRNAAGNVQSGQTFNTIVYDAAGRRISKALANTGSWDCTYHYYLDRNSAVEVRNGSNQTLKQYAWGTGYIDELVQVSVNADPTVDNTCETAYWACQDANYNVLGVVDSAGVLKERYS